MARLIAPYNRVQLRFVNPLFCAVPSRLIVL